MIELANSVTQYLRIFWEYFRNVIDIVLVAFIFYLVYRFLANTRAIQLLKGVMIIIIVAILAKFLHFDTLDWLITNIASSVVIAVIILFQPELRRLITQFGQRNWLATEAGKEPFPLDELVNAVVSMSEEKIGSLIVIERNTGLRSYAETGVLVNADISEEFIRTVFFPLTPLHDGAIIIQEGRITAAACYLPLSDSKQLKKQHGARHRAALGIAEESDALVLLTSEETGSICIMVNGRLFSRVRAQDLKNMILFFMNPKTAYEERFRVPTRKGAE
ncbi:MAG TPA: diadenylate cyclase CdaA [Spirochaetota bacterium]|nr:diadenylate cyclase CdaA [Spirochaetota bacterium]HPC42986.1 diadenylate cyclase CdaA [Spirochaetota bacterium]HQF10085.1 diadenylate cyclase CdaA [Spirochaetota bacterium]HQH98825.1 diadenylate cyclase CdaA [Spirochaetota bacterium]HQJ70477.1 diadenylate cyclase CdaA [Spirochaetota bacterium]